MARQGFALLDAGFGSIELLVHGRFYGIHRTSKTSTACGKQTLLLTHIGRKTGKPHEVTIWFAVDGDKLFIGTANVNRQWVRNVQKTPQVKFSIGGVIFRGTARFLSDRSLHERAMAAIRRKYWMFRPIIELGRFLSRIGLMRHNTGSFEVHTG
jgi:deazaflavin-dependent oxidoreductase (nitroreductase family)